MAGDLVEPRAGRFQQRVVDAHHDVRRGVEMLEAFGGERGDLGERLAQHELGRKLAGDRDRKLDRLGFEPLLDRREPARQPIERVADLLERDGGAALGDRGALLLGGGEAVAEALALGLGELERVLRRRDRPRRRLPAAKSWSNRNFAASATMCLSRPALRRASWR